jgi:hypothetical protein
VVVIGGGARPPRAHGIATYHYSASMKLDVDDGWTYYDPQWGTTTGRCNAEVGSGLRVIHLDVRFPNVTYDRDPSIGAELLYEDGVHARFGVYTETIKAKVATDASQLVTCPGGTLMEPTADQSADCYHNFTGKQLLLDISWGPTTTKNRLLWTNDGPTIPPGSCGNQIVGALGLVGVKTDVLPLNLVGYRVDYDEGQTSPATPQELDALRADRAFTVNRRVLLDFTTPCCDGFNPGAGGIYARIAAIHRYSATLSIRFTPRG